MKVIVLGAGHGTRLTRDIKNSNGFYDHLLDVPKLLLPINKKPLMTRWIEIFEKIPEIESVYIGTNDKFVGKLKSWLSDISTKLSINIASDGTTTNENRNGATSCIKFVMDQFQLNDCDVIIMAGDLLFKENFNLSNMIKQFKVLKEKYKKATLLASYKCKDQDVSKHGILELEGEDKNVISMLEKPDISETTSRNACPCFYMMTREHTNQINEFIHVTKDQPMKLRDAPGNFVKYLIKNNKEVFAYEVKSGRFDVGNIRSYQLCDEYFDQIENCDMPY